MRKIKSALENPPGSSTGITDSKLRDVCKFDRSFRKQNKSIIFEVGNGVCGVNLYSVCENNAATWLHDVGIITFENKKYFRKRRGSLAGRYRSRNRWIFREMSRTSS